MVRTGTKHKEPPRDHSGSGNCFAVRWPTEPVALSTESGTCPNGATTTILRSNFKSQWPGQDKIPLTKFPRSTEEKRGTVLCIHGLGESSRKVTAWIAKKFAARGYESAAITLPYHGSRIPSGCKPTDFFLEADRFHLRQYFENAVVDTMTTAAYLHREEEPLYLFASSMGGFIATIAAAFSQDIRKMALVVSGGNYYEVTWRSMATKLLRKRYEANGACNAQKCFRVHSADFPVFREKLNTPLIPLDSTPRACFEYDPVTYAPYVKQPVLMMNARLDMFIPRKAVLELYRSLPDPVLQWFTAGHWSSVFYIPFILRHCDTFFKGPETFLGHRQPG